VTWRRAVWMLAVAGALLAGSLWWLTVLGPLAWVFCAWRWPFAPCWSCSGRKTNRGSTRRRYGRCRRCDGSGMRQVTGSKTLHRAIRSAARYRDNRKVKP
jgi:hypothetical protein